MFDKLEIDRVPPNRSRSHPSRVLLGPSKFRPELPISPVAPNRRHPFDNTNNFISDFDSSVPIASSSPEHENQREKKTAIVTERPIDIEFTDRNTALGDPRVERSGRDCKGLARSVW